MPKNNRERDERRVGREVKTIEVMVDIYCQRNHSPESVPCEECRDVLRYARKRIDHCPFLSNKPTCANCPIHCYKPGQRARAKMIMRYAGPRMLLRHPYLTIRHQLDGFRKVEHPRELTREERLKSASR